MDSQHIGLTMAGMITMSKIIVALLSYACWPYMPVRIRRYHALLVIPMTLIVFRRMLYLFRINGFYSGLVFENIILLVVSLFLMTYFWLILMGRNGE